MAENSKLGPRYPQWRFVIAVVALIVLLSVCAAWLNGWSYFAFPLGTFLVWFGVPVGLVAIAMMVPGAEDEEALDP